MEQKFKTRLLFFISMLALPAYSQPLTEADFIALARDKSPHLSKLEAASRQQELNLNRFEEKFGATAFANGNYSDTNELSYSPTFPIFGPTQTVSVGVRKSLRKGISSSVALAVDQRSTTDSMIENLTTTGIEASVSIDLWKNFLGRMDQNNFNANLYSLQASQIRSQIQQKEFELNIRKIYWAMIANREAQQLTQELLKNAEKQLSETRERFKASVASRSDVSRLKAQVSVRKNVVKSLQIQRTQLELQIKTLLPSLAEKEYLSLASVNLNQAVENVFQCTEIIKKSNRSPLANTKYSKLISSLDSHFNSRKSVISRHDEIDLKLTGSYGISGRSDSYNNSVRRIEDSTINGFAIALELSAPIGGHTKRTKNSELALEQARYESERDALLLNLKAQRKTIMSQIDLLYETIAYQRETTNLLTLSSRDIEKQYRQARISLIELIREQDSLQDSQLNKIDAYLLVINTLFDYLKVFTETPCNINS